MCVCVCVCASERNCASSANLRPALFFLPALEKENPDVLVTHESCFNRRCRRLCDRLLMGQSLAEVANLQFRTDGTAPVCGEVQLELRVPQIDSEGAAEV
jgi:hypothetical protein